MIPFCHQLKMGLSQANDLRQPLAFLLDGRTPSFFDCLRPKINACDSAYALRGWALHDTMKKCLKVLRGVGELFQKFPDKNRVPAPLRERRQGLGWCHRNVPLLLNQAQVLDSAPSIGSI